MVVNTCSVTATADQGARQMVRKVARENPGARIVVTGCYATRRPDELGALPGVVRVVPNSDKDHVAHLLLSLEPGAWSLGPESTTSERYSGLHDGPCGARLAPGVAGRHRIHAAGPNRVRPAVQLLHHPGHARGGPVEAGGVGTGGGCRRRPRRLPRDRRVRRASRVVRPGSARRLVACRLGPDAGRLAGRRPVSHQLAGTDGLRARARGGRGGVVAASPRTCTCRCSTATTRCCARCGGRTRRSITKSW